MYVVHPSLLPKYRGATPIHTALLHGDLVTGVSLVELSKGTFDAGDVVMQEKLKIENDDTFESLSSKLASLSSRMLLDLIDNKNKIRIPQDSSQVSLAPKFGKDANIYLLGSDPQRSARKAFNMYRAFKGSSMKSFKLSTSGRTFFIDSCSLLDYETLDANGVAHVNRVEQAVEVGTIFMFNNLKPLKGKLAIKFEDGWLVVNSLHESGQQEMPARLVAKDLLPEQQYRSAIDSIARGTPITSQLVLID